MSGPREVKRGDGWTLLVANWDTCGSPVEKLYLAALAIRISKSPEASAVIVAGQIDIDRFRPDFIVSEIRKDGGQRSIFVEIDGHDFHEKTKEQVAKDRRKDRAFVLKGLTLVRFTGSEVFRDSDKCAEETLQLLFQQPLSGAQEAAQ